MISFKNDAKNTIYLMTQSVLSYCYIEKVMKNCDFDNFPYHDITVRFTARRDH